MILDLSSLFGAGLLRLQAEVQAGMLLAQKQQLAHQMAMQQRQTAAPDDGKTIDGTCEEVAAVPLLSPPEKD